MQSRDRGGRGLIEPISSPTGQEAMLMTSHEFPT